MTPARKSVRTGIWCLTCFILIFIALIANIYRRGTVSDIRKADVLLVLGAAQWNNKPSPIFQARLDRAQELYAAGYAPRIIVTGGRASFDAISDSRVGKTYLAQNGVNPDHILTEENSRTTLQNLVFAGEIMGSRRIQSAILISSDFHIMRAARMAQDLDITAYPAPVKTKNQLSKLRYALRETAMYAAYLLFHI